MAISDEITRLQQAKAALKTSIEGKGVTVPSDATLDDYPALVDSIEAGGGDEENVWYFCCAYWAKYLLTYQGNGYWTADNIRYIKPLNKSCWFEFNGEKYYVDSFSDGTHTLTKQGTPVVCNISTFVTFKINQSGSNYVLSVVED